MLGTIAFFTWKYFTRREDYTGGDVHTTGTVEAVHVQLGFQVTGRLADVPVVEGNRVSAGQVVGRLETQDLEGEVRSAKAALETARAAVAEARATRDKTGRDLARTHALVSSDATTPQQVDAAQAASEVARAQVQAAEARVGEAESALAQAQLQLSHTELRAPEAGEVSEKIHHAGEMVMAGTPIITVAQTDTVKVHAAVDETRVGAIRPGDVVQLRVYTFDKKTFAGVVTDVRPAGDFATRKDWGAQRRDIRTFTVTARVPNPDHLLKDGMTADVTIDVSAPVQAVAEGKS